GFSGQFSYVFSKNLGDTGVRDPRNRQISHGILSNNRTHIVKFTGTLDLPFGAKGFIGRNHLADRIIGGWQLAPVIQWASGAPLSFTTANGTAGFRATNTADIVNPINPGKVRVDGGAYVEYFAGFKTQTAVVPAFGSDAATLAGRYTNLQVVDANGNVVFQNPAPGRTGNTALNMPGMIGPGQLGADLSLAKKFALGEARAFTFRIDALDVLNRKIWGTPGTNINNATTFGRITTTGGSRTMTLNARFDF
ncbi:MAG: hypothetical protein ABI995_13960, partial [Acidobacteriota bacterium]